MSLEVIDFTQQKKHYKFEAGTFTLKPPYMYIVRQVMPLVNESKKFEGKDFLDNREELEESVNLQLQALKIILEETGDGTLENLNQDNFRPDVAAKILTDFFLQCRM